MSWDLRLWGVGGDANYFLLGYSRPFILDAPFQMETIDAVRVPLSPSLYQNDGVLFLQIYFTQNYTWDIIKVQ